MSTEPWQRYEAVPGHNATIVTKPSVVAALLRRAKNPIVIAGSEVRPEEAELVARLAGAVGCPVIATSTAVAAFARTPAACIGMPALEIAARIDDPAWSAGDRPAPHDLVLILGVPFVISSVLEAGWNSFGRHLRVISIDRHYHPHCSFSFPELPRDRWLAELGALVREAGG